MTFLLDTNVLLRLHQIGHPQQAQCAALMKTSQQERPAFTICTQTLIEFWVVATRPPARNGLGYSHTLAAAAIGNLLDMLPFISDPPDLFARWRALVGQYAVHGLPAHDAKLVALVDAFKMDGIITFNSADFARYPVSVLTPQQWLTANPRQSTP